MHIPGLGCLKGCLVTLVVLFVAGWLVWELSPLQEWIGTTKGYWDQLTTWIGGTSPGGSRTWAAPAPTDRHPPVRERPGGRHVDIPAGDFPLAVKSGLSDA
ncbi:hypothetical protein SFUMM280S_07192 [Streptomyces fumanus]